MKKQMQFIAAVVSVVFLLSSKLQAEEPIHTTVANEGFAGTFYDVPGHNKPIGLIVLGGSEGGIPVRSAKSFADEGYPILALGYFKTAGTPKYLDRIPLEYFDKPLDWLADQPSLEGKKIVVIGGSKGAELALLLASKKKQIAGVIAIAPSSVVFQSIPKVFWPPQSSWTQNGKPISYVLYDISKGIDVKNLRPLYEQSLTHKKLVTQAAIPVEKISGPVLLLSGEDDQMWPASDMADSIVSRLKASKFAHSFEHIKYKNAGHTLNEYFMMGGTREGNKKSRIDSWKKQLSFLSKNF